VTSGTHGSEGPRHGNVPGLPGGAAKAAGRKAKAAGRKIHLLAALDHATRPLQLPAAGCRDIASTLRATPPITEASGLLVVSVLGYDHHHLLVPVSSFEHRLFDDR
jgi:hypothetical protein